MVSGGGGVITNISSGAAGGGFTTKLLDIGGGFDVSSYYASKAGLEGLTRVTASMGGPDNIRVNAIRPCLIVDKHGHHWLEGFRDLLQILEGQVEAEDVANMVLFLSSEDARYVTGQTMEVGGGFICKLG